ncbi:major facilitator superfamily domain-containing protein [Suillus lakei]|nr:major facilitator superfamily domain-containing protein [Suillus lakei]
MSPRFIRELIPRRENRAPLGAVVIALRSLTWVQWAQFWSGSFGKSTSAILTLLFRSVGAVIFGMISDRFGRKWPLVVNLILCGVLELGTGFVNTFSQFLALRALFGIAMGGIWGLSSSSALENLPVELRGPASGILQEGLSYRHGWRALFWAGAGITCFAAVIRALIPESPNKRRRKGPTTSRNFLRETKEMLKLHWLLCIYAVLLMSGLNFLSHGSQDLSPRAFSAHNATVATIISNCVRSYSGGAIGGWASQYVGRRLTIVLCSLAVFIPLWVLPSSFSALSAGAFCIQVGVQGAWGCPFRATFPGVVYQIGNMVSAASAQIEATGGDNLKTTIMENGVLTVVPDYATVQAIFIGVVAAYVVVIAIIGPENHGSHFENADAASGDGTMDHTSQMSYREVDEKSSA